MSTPSSPADFAALLVWYHANKRTMPWRGHPEPYAVWVSEIMLQQTQVATVMGYFDRFLAAFPTIADLAAAESDPLLKAWEGLGYYTRVRNLQKAAQQVLRDHAGQMPRCAADLAQLPGIGAYTAAAIASICYGQAEPVVDGNVARVFARHDNLTDDFTKPKPRAALADRLRGPCADSGEPGNFNQAMMELGALICTPRKPQCPACPLAARCYAKAHDAQDSLPIKPPKKAHPTRSSTAVIIRNSQDQVYLVRNDNDRLLGGLWRLPTCEEITTACGHELDWQACGLQTHQFTHFKLELSLYTAPDPGLTDTIGHWAHPDSLPLATAHKKSLARL